MHKPSRANLFFAIALLASLTISGSLCAQTPFSSSPQKDKLNDPFGQFNLGGPAVDEERVTVSAEFKVEPKTGNGKLFVTGKIAPSYHLYSIHNPSASLPTKLTIKENDAVFTSGSFRPLKRPTIHYSDVFEEWEEYHEGEVVWVAPFRLKPGVDPASLELQVDLEGQACNEGGCFDVMASAVAGYAGKLPAGELTMKEAPSPPTSPIAGASASPEVTFKGDLKVETGKQQGWLIVHGDISPGAHIYSQYNSSDSVPVTFAPEEADAISDIGNFAPVVDPHVYYNPLFEQFEESFDGKITWIAPVKLKEDADPKSVAVDIAIAGQVCDFSCLPFDEKVPAKFSGFADQQQIAAMAEAVAGDRMSQVATTDGDKESGVLNLDNLDVQGVDTEQYSFGIILLLALLGGFILNFMPCVLPVIGLKVMSFINQAGKSRTQALVLNLWYVFGMLTVFMVLATLAVVFNLGWGQQSQSVAFNIVMASVVFVMGLSFLGVWEIPIPGFVGTGKAAEVAQQEGPSAAFVKGIITTILAVPCSGPGLATALAYSAGKPPWMVYTIFLFLGLGMAAPYIVIGIKPELVKFLPKPGMWMETFKQVMGFFLLGTVVFVMSYITWKMRLATLAFLFGLWFCCWLIGRIPITADSGVKVRTWILATTFAVVFGFLSFTWIADLSQHRFDRDIDKEIARRLQDDTPAKTTKVSADKLHWEPFSVQRLTDETAEQATVLVDFTADW